jgi:hypothetical protein
MVARPRVVPRQLLVGGALIVAGLAATVLATYVLIPAFGGRSDYYFTYTALGHNVPQAAWHLITHPVSSLDLLITPRVKLVTMAWLFGAFCFLPLLSPITLAMIPLLLERMLGSTLPNWWVTSYQYNAFLVVILVLAAVDGAARLDRWVSVRRRAGPAAAQSPAGSGAPGPAAGKAAPSPARNGTGRVGLACAVALCIVAVGLVPVFAFKAAFQPSFFQRTPRMRAAVAADAHVPSGVTVGAVNYLGPALSARDTVLLWDGDGSTPVRLPWIIADTARPEFTFRGGLKQQRERVAYLERTGYRVVFQRRGYVVLHKTGGQGATASASTSGPAG